MQLLCYSHLAWLGLIIESYQYDSFISSSIDISTNISLIISPHFWQVYQSVFSLLLGFSFFVWARTSPRLSFPSHTFFFFTMLILLTFASPLTFMLLVFVLLITQMFWLLRNALRRPVRFWRKITINVWHGEMCLVHPLPLTNMSLFTSLRKSKIWPSPLLSYPHLLFTPALTLAF